MPMGDLPAYHAKRLGSTGGWVRHGDTPLNWGGVDGRSARGAWALKAHGVKKDDIVVLGLPNCSELYELTFAIWKLGATPSVVSWRLPVHEFRAVIGVAQPKAVFASDPTL